MLMVVLASSKMVIKLKVSPLKGNALTKTIREKRLEHEKD